MGNPGIALVIPLCVLFLFIERCDGQSRKARIFKLLTNPGIDSKESIPPAYVAWRAGTISLFLLGS
jgi:hypothetical protein